MSYTLVVIDMQEAFYAARNPYTLHNVIREIKRARKNKCGIVVVRYENSGCLLYRISQALDNYHNIDYVWKNTNDGGPEVYDSIVSNYFNHDKIVVCGVNTDACVCETVETLCGYLPYTQIEVVEDACNSIDFNDFSWISDLSNVFLRENVLQ